MKNRANSYHIDKAYKSHSVTSQRQGVTRRNVFVSNESDDENIATSLSPLSMESATNYGYQSSYPQLTRSNTWTKDENDKLLAGVEIFGLTNWVSVSRLVSTKNNNQCRQRYYKVADPSIKKGFWNREEDKLLTSVIFSMGEVTSWQEVADKIPGRTSKQCMERWKNHLALGPKSNHVHSTNIIESSPIMGRYRNITIPHHSPITSSNEDSSQKLMNQNEESNIQNVPLYVENESSLSSSSSSSSCSPSLSQPLQSSQSNRSFDSSSITKNHVQIPQRYGTVITPLMLYPESSYFHISRNNSIHPQLYQQQQQQQLDLSLKALEPVNLPRHYLSRREAEHNLSFPSNEARSSESILHYDPMTYEFMLNLEMMQSNSEMVRKKILDDIYATL